MLHRHLSQSLKSTHALFVYLDAACLMLKHKIHRIPVVDKNAQVIGMVTRTDIFTALEAESPAA